MKGLLIIAHGSRRDTSNDEVRQLTQLISDHDSEFEIVECAFLELATPSIPNGLELCITQGAEEVIVMPYFLAAGRHVVEDIPAEVEPIVQKYPDVSVSIADHLGLFDHMAKVILHQAGETQF